MTFSSRISGFHKLSMEEKLTKLKESSLEKSEKLEQLRFLENGYKIFTIVTDYNSVSVDTKEDLKKVNKMVSINY